MKSIFRFASFFAVATLLISLSAFAGVPATLNYQGTLTDNTGQSVSGSKTVTFRLYDAPTGGTAFWTEEQTINLVNGRLSVVLGGNAGNPIDPKKFTGETYIGIQVAPDTEMPRQKFTSVAYAFQAGEGGVPSGGIIMWSGAADAIPAGWALCNGQNGTPDLRDRFVVGAGSSYSPGNTGGLVANSIPDHQHSVNFNTGGVSGTFYGVDEDHSPPNVPGNHTHNVNGNTGSAGSIGYLENRPPYYALAFIMKL